MRLALLMTCCIGFISFFRAGIIPVSAERKDDPEFYFRLGQQMNDEGNYDLAINNLLKVLIFDTSNIQAKEMLKKTVEEFYLEQPVRMQFYFHVIEQIDYYNFLKDEIKKFEFNNEHLLGFVRSNSLQSSDAIKIRYDFMENLADLERKIDRHDSDFLLLAESETVDFDKLHSHLAEANSEYTYYLQLLKNLNGQLLDINKGLTIQIWEIKKDALFKDKIQKLEDALVQLTKKDEIIHEQRQKMSSVTLEFEGLKHKFSAMEAKLEETNNKLLELTRNIAALSLEVFEKERYLVDQNSLRLELEEKLHETKERHDLLQAIMQKKDDQIQQLEQALSVASTGQMGNFESILSPGQKSTPEASDSRLSFLEKQITELSGQYQELLQKFSVKDSEITRLHEQALTREEKVNTLKKIAESKDQKLSEFHGMLIIYKEKLEHARKDINEKNTYIQEFQKKLDGIFEQENDANLKTRRNILLGPWETNDPKSELDAFLMQKNEIIRKTIEKILSSR